ncbi:MAG: TatD family hydrolase [Brevinematales bacterium]|nr:TatD family hydrolase [Brevinematales bacterium]
MYIDTHCHLTHCFGSPSWPQDLTFDSIHYLIDISISPQEILSLSQYSPHPRIFRAFGFYPELCTMWTPEEKRRLCHWIETLNPLAIGEIGLDYHHHYGTPKLQQNLFVDQLALAHEYRKPVLIHSRNAFHDTFSLLKTFHPGTAVILHCFGYGPHELEQFLLLDNIFISFAGNVTYPSAHSLREALLRTPQERLFLETDAPYLSPLPMRGKRNTPLYIEHTYRYVADFLQLPLPTLCEMIATTFSRVFLSPKL